MIHESGSISVNTADIFLIIKKWPGKGGGGKMGLRRRNGL